MPTKARNAGTGAEVGLDAAVPEHGDNEERQPGRGHKWPPCTLQFLTYTRKSRSFCIVMNRKGVAALRMGRCGSVEHVCALCTVGFMGPAD